DDDNKKKEKGLEKKVAAVERRNIAELESKKLYNIIKGKGREMTDEKILWADPDDDSRFAAAISDHKYALDPTNPWFKRSLTYFKQIAQKQKEDPTSHEQVKAKETKSKEELSLGMMTCWQLGKGLAQLMKKKAKAN
ncbi:unnamed protein product, partial [Brassica oleracea]